MYRPRTLIYIVDVLFLRCFRILCFHSEHFKSMGIMQSLFFLKRCADIEALNMRCSNAHNMLLFIEDLGVECYVWLLTTFIRFSRLKHLDFVHTLIVSFHAYVYVSRNIVSLIVPSVHVLSANANLMYSRKLSFFKGGNHSGMLIYWFQHY